MSEKPTLECPRCGYSGPSKRRFGPDKHDSKPTIREVVRGLEDKTERGAPTELVILRLTEQGVTDAREKVDRAKRRGDVYEPHPKRLKVV